MDKCYLTAQFGVACRNSDEIGSTLDQNVIDPEWLKFMQSQKQSYREFVEENTMSVALTEFNIMTLEESIDAIFLDALTAAHNTNPELVQDVESIRAIIPSSDEGIARIPSQRAEWAAQEFIPDALRAVSDLGRLMVRKPELMQAFNEFEPSRHEGDSTGLFRLTTVADRLEDFARPAYIQQRLIENQTETEASLDNHANALDVPRPPTPA